MVLARIGPDCLNERFALLGTRMAFTKAAVIFRNRHQMAALTLLLYGGAEGPGWARDIGVAVAWAAAALSVWTGAAYLRVALRSIRDEGAA